MKKITTIFFFGLLMIGQSLVAQEIEGVSNPVKVSLKPKEIIPASLATTPAPANRYHALLIAVEEYEDKAINSLNEPLKDANKLKEILLKKYTFDVADIEILKNPTFEEMNVAFEQ